MAQASKPDGLATGCACVQSLIVTRGDATPPTVSCASSPRAADLYPTILTVNFDFGFRVRPINRFRPCRVIDSGKQREGRSVGMHVYSINAKTILSKPQGFLTFDWSITPYEGCTLGAVTVTSPRFTSCECVVCIALGGTRWASRRTHRPCCLRMRAEGELQVHASTYPQTLTLTWDRKSSMVSPISCLR